MGNAAVGAINEAEWKAAEPSINKQINTAISNIWGDDSTSAASGNAVAIGYQAYTANADPISSGSVGMAGSDAVGDSNAPAGADQGAGFPIMWQGDPSNPADVAALQAEMRHFQAYLASANGQSLVPGYPLPPTSGDFQAQLTYGKTAAEAISEARNYAEAVADDVPVTPTSAMQQDIAEANAAQADTETALSSLQGSVGGDMLYGALTLGTRGLLDLGVAAESVADIATDRLSAEQAVTGFGNMLWNVGSAAVHPVNTYNHLVNGMTGWFGESPDQQARDIGRFGIDTLLSFGTEGIAAKGFGYIDTLADGFGSASRLDYSANFANDLRNFNAGYTHFSGTLDDDLLLVQFHRADRALGQGRSAAWWTTPDQANQFFTTGDMRQELALPPGWGPRDAVSIARIPQGTDVEFFQGTALRQTESNILFGGNGTQYRFRNFDPNWIIQTRKIPGAQ